MSEEVWIVPDDSVLDGSIGSGYFDYIVKGFLGYQREILTPEQAEWLVSMSVEEKQQFVLDSLSDSTWSAIDADLSAAVLKRVDSFPSDEA